MKKFMVIIALVVAMICTTGCSGYTQYTSGNWTAIETHEGEVIYDGPTEYVDDDYEMKSLKESEYNYIYNWETEKFEITKRGQTEFNK